MHADRQSLEHQRDSLRATLSLIAERKAAFVSPTDVPLQLLHDERAKQRELADVERQLAALAGAPPAPELPPPVVPPAPDPVPTPPAPEPPAPASPSPPSSGGNPFTPGTVVPPERFIGRSSLISDIRARLLNMGSISLVGDARIGKSSLLSYLKAQLPTLVRERTTEVYLPIYLSLDSIPTRAEFVHEIIQRVTPCLPPAVHPQRTTSDTSTAAMQECFDIAHAHKLRVVLLLDEFKTLLDHPHEFNETFLGSLRSAYTHSKVALIVATRQPLSAIPAFNPYFANGMTQMEIGRFTPAEADQFLRQPHAYPFTPAERDLGKRIGACHPLRLQWAGSLLYESRAAQAHGTPSRYHQPDGSLHWRAGSRLQRDVFRKYHYAVNMSRPTAAEHPLPNPVALLGSFARRLGAFVSQWQDHLLGVVLIIFGVLVLVYVFGGLTWEQLRDLWGMLNGA